MDLRPGCWPSFRAAYLCQLWLQFQANCPGVLFLQREKGQGVAGRVSGLGEDNGLSLQDAPSHHSVNSSGVQTGSRGPSLVSVSGHRTWPCHLFLMSICGSTQKTENTFLNDFKEAPEGCFKNDPRSNITFLSYQCGHVT